MAQAKIETEKNDVQKILDKMAVDQLAIQQKIDGVNAEITKQQELQRIEIANYQAKIDKSRENQAIEMAQYQAKIDKQIIDNAKELADYTKLMDEKKAQIVSEYDIYKNLVAQKQQLDSTYFAKFGEQLRAQLAQVDSLANRISSLSI